MHAGMGGKHHFEVYINTNDERAPVLIFHVRANSLEDPSVKPHRKETDRPFEP